MEYKVYLSGNAHEVHHKLINLIANAQAALPTVLAHTGNITVTITSDSVGVANQPDPSELLVSVDF